MRVKEIMQRRFAALQPGDSLDRVLEVLSSRGVTSIPVLEKDELVGIVTFSSVAKFFMPKGILGGPAPSDANAAKMAIKPPFILTPDQPVSLVLQKIVDVECCIPVMSGKSMVGLVRKGDVLEHFLSEQAKEEVAGRKGADAHPEKKPADAEDSTTIDKMLEIVHREGETSTRKVAKELGITEKAAEDLAKLLDKHKLARINYSFLSGLMIRRMEHGE